MENKAKWNITESEKKTFIEALSNELPALRAKAGVPQDELAKLIGISRQTYGAIERKAREMSWSTYLSLILFFDYNKSTHSMLRNLSAFPAQLIDRFNDGKYVTELNLEDVSGISIDDINEKLDSQALYAIRTVIMLEYARCNNLTGDAVIKSFDGRSFVNTVTPKDISVKKSLKNIRGQGSARK